MKMKWMELVRLEPKLLQAADLADIVGAAGRPWWDLVRILMREKFFYVVGPVAPRRKLRSDKGIKFVLAHLRSVYFRARRLRRAA